MAWNPTGNLKGRGVSVYRQDEEPVDALEGDVWADETESPGGGVTVYEQNGEPDSGPAGDFWIRETATPVYVVASKLDGSTWTGTFEYDFLDENDQVLEHFSTEGIGYSINAHEYSASNKLEVTAVPAGVSMDYSWEDGEGIHTTHPAMSLQGSNSFYLIFPEE